MSTSLEKLRAMLEEVAVERASKANQRGTAEQQARSYINGTAEPALRQAVPVLHGSDIRVNELVHAKPRLTFQFSKLRVGPENHDGGGSATLQADVTHFDSFFYQILATGDDSGTVLIERKASVGATEGQPGISYETKPLGKLSDGRNPNQEAILADLTGCLRSFLQVAKEDTSYMSSPEFAQLLRDNGLA